MKKNLIKKVMVGFLMLVFVMGAFVPEKTEAVSKPKMSVTKLNLTVGQSKQLTVKNNKKKITWSSSKKSVATVTKNGKIAAKKAGTANIYASIGKTRLKCTVTVAKKKSSSKNKVLVTYFSATGSTKKVATFIKDAANADIYEIKPKVPYTSNDLDYTKDSSRVSQEHQSGIEPEISGKISNIKQYDVIFIGYPIWWQEAPNITHTFLKSHNLSGKIIIPFCTSISSGLGSSADNLHKFAPKAIWQDGKQFSSSASKSSVEKWVKELKY